MHLSKLRHSVLLFITSKLKDFGDVRRTCYWLFLRFTSTSVKPNRNQFWMQYLRTKTIEGIQMSNLDSIFHLNKESTLTYELFGNTRHTWRIWQRNTVSTNTIWSLYLSRICILSECTYRSNIIEWSFKNLRFYIFELYPLFINTL